MVHFQNIYWWLGMQKVWSSLLIEYYGKLDSSGLFLLMWFWEDFLNFRLAVRSGQVAKWPAFMALKNVEMKVLNPDFWYNLASCNFMLQKIPTLNLCWKVCNGVIEGSLLNLLCCILFNITWDYFFRFIVYITVEESCGPFIWGSIYLL